MQAELLKLTLVFRGLSDDDEAKEEETELEGGDDDLKEDDEDDGELGPGGGSDGDEVDDGLIGEE